MTNLLLYVILVLFIKKKDSSVYLMCELNYITWKDRYLLPLIANLLSLSKNACVYIKINLYYTYYLVQIIEEDKMEDYSPYSIWIFLDILNVYIVVYFNDILIYLDNMFQHKDHVKKVLWWLQKTGLYVKAEKCEFHSDFIEYLEYILSLSRLFMSSDKIKTIQSWPEPRKIKDI